MIQLDRGRVWIATRLAAPRRHSLPVWLRWAVGTLAALSLSLVLADPGLLVLAVDPELIALIVLSSIALMRINTPAVFRSAWAATRRCVATVAAELTGRREPSRRAASAPGPSGPTAQASHMSTAMPRSS